MIIYQSRFLTRGEVWFNEEPARRNLDWLLYNQYSQPVPRSKWKYFHSYVVDLEGSPHEVAEAVEGLDVRVGPQCYHGSEPHRVALGHDELERARIRASVVARRRRGDDEGTFRRGSAEHGHQRHR